MTKYRPGVWYGMDGMYCPVHPDTQVEVQYNNIDETCETGRAGDFNWDTPCTPDAFISLFRVIPEKPTPNPEVKTLRDEFAMVALSGSDFLLSEQSEATWAYKMADAMMEARKK